MEFCTDKTKKIIIAIDGFSSCGKSTFAKSIAVWAISSVILARCTAP